MLFNKITETRRAWSGPLRAPFKDAPFCHNYIRHPVYRHQVFVSREGKPLEHFKSNYKSSFDILSAKINKVVFKL